MSGTVYYLELSEHLFSGAVHEAELYGHLISETVY